jgi:hypothetical protein
MSGISRIISIIFLAIGTVAFVVLAEPTWAEYGLWWLLLAILVDRYGRK